MSLAIAGQRPPRLTLANIVTGDSIEAQFNPTGFEESIEVGWAHLKVPGLSHERLHFVNTENLKLSLELTFDALDPASSLDAVLKARRFLMSLCYPVAGEDVPSTSPPRVLVVWPSVVSLTCVVGSLSFKYNRFNLQGTPVQFTAKLALEEIRDVRLTSDEVLAEGSQRPAAAPEGG